MTIAIREITCQSILSRSQIPLGDAVINPYRGCAWGCLYCYVRKNKQVMKRAEAWGTYVDIKVNARQMLMRQLEEERPKRVVLGSTTEVYQPIEEKYGLTRSIIELLNEKRIPVTIMTRSPGIARDCALIAENPDPVVYFTVTPLDESVRAYLEGAAPQNPKRQRAIEALIGKNILVHVYLNPLIPYAFCVDALFQWASKTVEYLDMETLNPQMCASSQIIKRLAFDQSLPQAKIKEVFADKRKWDVYWQAEKIKLDYLARDSGLRVQSFFHPFAQYFHSLPYEQK
jgi:DNA repair photolyase